MGAFWPKTWPYRRCCGGQGVDSWVFSPMPESPNLSKVGILTDARVLELSTFVDFSPIQESSNGAQFGDILRQNRVVCLSAATPFNIYGERRREKIDHNFDGFALGFFTEEGSSKWSPMNLNVLPINPNAILVLFPHYPVRSGKT